MTILEWPTVRDALKSVVDTRGLSWGELSRMTGISRSTLQGALGNADAQWNTTARILSALELDYRWVHSLTTGEKKKCKGRTSTAKTSTAKTTARSRGEGQSHSVRGPGKPSTAARR